MLILPLVCLDATGAGIAMAVGVGAVHTLPIACGAKAACVGGCANSVCGDGCEDEDGDGCDVKGETSRL